MGDKFASIIGSQRPEAANIVVFGASGDLTRRKLLPALAHMHRWNLLGPQSRIVGAVREPWSLSHWKNYVHDALLRYFPDSVLNPPSWRRIAEKLDIVVGDLADLEMYSKLAGVLHADEGRRNALFYLAIPPSWYECVARNLHESGLAGESEGYRRIVIEKPFGMDLDSARNLNASLQQFFDESQIYRIDHYLGKEAVQNLLIFRFANSVLEPLWNRNYIDHVQITVAESVGIEYRAGYYEQAGALRDMIQSHLIQVMALVAMEPPVSLDEDAIRDEKVKVMRAVRRMQVKDVYRYAVRAQYAEGTIHGEAAPGYRQERGVAEDSVTETFAAVRLYVDNWRWQDVPFVLRTGKCLPERVSEICIRFREPPQTLFCLNKNNVRNNELTFRLQPDAGMMLTMTAKQPGLSNRLRGIHLDAPYAMSGASMPDAYETLLHDVLTGDASLFTRADGIEECWSIVAPILEAWAHKKTIALYHAGNWDVPDMDRLMEGCAGGWRDLSDGEHAN